MQSIVQGISPIWSKHMSRIKSRHYFEIGELVIAHPIIPLFYKDIERGDFGIVLERYPPKHPTNDYRKVRIFWQKSMKDETYYAHHLYHLHHEEEIEKIYDEWVEKLNTIRNSDLMKYRSMGASSHYQNMQILEKLGVSIDRFPLDN